MVDATAALLQRLFDRAPDGMVVSRLRDGRIVLVNDALCSLLGYSSEEMVGHCADEFGLWPGAKERAAAKRRLESQARLATHAAQLRTRDGAVLDVEISAELVHIGRAAHAFSITRDVSERVAAERAVRESEERFRTLVHSSRDAIIVTDAQGLIIYCSPGIEHVLGYAPEDLIGTHERQLIQEEDLRVRDTHVKRLLAGDEPQPPVELRMRHLDGTMRWVETIDTNRLADPAVSGIVTNARDITERKASDETYAFRALHDALTGLPNRRLLDDRIELALARLHRSHRTVAVLFCDLDRFKEVNDSLGHEAGDELLREMAQRLRSILRPNDSLARLGGDEFVIVCGDLANVEAAALLAERIISTIRAPLDLLGGPAQVTVSIGIATATGPKPEIDAGRLVRNADAAMYRAKDRGRDRWEIFDAAMQEHVRLGVELAEQLEAGFEAGHLEVFYQPIVSLPDADIVGVEALLRWNHPTRGLLTPGEFLDTAESTGLIVRIGDWVLGEAIGQLRSWHASDHETLWASVNISGRQLGEPGIRATLFDRLATSGLHPGSLRLELTETVLIEHSAAVEADLAAAVDLGVRVGIDDFGTSYASLAYLRQFPISFLKIDSSFVADLGSNGAADEPGDRADLVAAILQLSRTMRIEAIAEGVETSDQAATLAALGCSYGQGYLFGTPVAASQMTGMLSARQNGA
jgi:diguanylate cyclase (GGDEF)-like protein/PAS domain S-box-containing protein